MNCNRLLGKGLYLLTLFVGLFCECSFSQSGIKEYVLANTSAISAINPDSTNFDDLNSFGQAIGEASVVMLGEQDHGDAPTFSAKSRLIKYLHETKGFNVLIFEGDYFVLNYGWDNLLKNRDNINGFIRTNIYPIWSYCDACQDLLYKYIYSTLRSPNPLQISGIDNQVNTSKIIGPLDSILRRTNFGGLDSNEYKVFMTLFSEWGNVVDDSIRNSIYTNYLSIIRRVLSANRGSTDFWVSIIDNLLAQDLQFTKSLGFWNGVNTRDRQMANNLIWLLSNKFKNEKVIVWAHSSHVAKYSGHFEQKFLNPGKSMGTNFIELGSYADKTYILGFTSYEGTSGRLTSNKPYKLDDPRGDGFENWVNHSYKFAFVDFKQFNNMEPRQAAKFYMAGAAQPNNWYHKDVLAEWTKIFDGIFFIRTMYPCKSISFPLND